MSKTALAIGEIIGGVALLIFSGPIGAAFFLSAQSLLALQTIAITTILTGTIGLIPQPSTPVSVVNGSLSVNNPVAFRRVCYGTTAINAGVPTFSDYPIASGNFQNSGYDYQWLHFVFTLTGHQISQFLAVVIDGIFFQIGTDLVLQGNGYYELTSAAAASGYFDGSSGYNTGSLVAFEFDTGDPLNAAQPFPGLAAASSTKWTSACKQRGCAKVHVAFRYCADLASNPSNLSPAPFNPYNGSRIPRLKFHFVGKPLLDTRSPVGSVGAQTAVSSINLANGMVTCGVADPTNFAAGAMVEAGITYALGFNLVRLQGSFPVFRVSGGSVILKVPNASGGSGSSVVGTLTLLSSGYGAAANLSNPALAVYDYLTDTDYGMAADPISVDISTVNAAANLCDENVISEWTNIGIVEEKLYACDGMFDHSQTRGSVLKSLCDSMAGFAVPPGDLWRIYAGSSYAPNFTLTDADLRDSIKGDFRLSRRDICNGIKGTFFPSNVPIAANSPLAHLPPAAWEQTDFPPYQGNGLNKHPDYITEDGGQIIWKDIQLPFTVSLYMAQRLAKITLQKLRRQVTLNLACKMTAYQVQAGDIIIFIHQRWAALNPAPPTWFFVQQVTLVLDTSKEKPALGVDLVLREIDNFVYSFLAPTGPSDQGEYSPYGTTGFE